jgi:NAD(P)-dependent dehydrogenase (short-subunit alcohol dehydrogenase family)
VDARHKAGHDGAAIKAIFPAGVLDCKTGCLSRPTAKGWQITLRRSGDRRMKVKDKVCVVTGGASGIGEAVARAYAAAGARGVVVADLRTSRDKLASVAGDIDGLAVTGDVGEEQDIKALIKAAEDKFGPVDVFFSNAGLSRKGQESASDADWDVSWRVHVMSHVFAARVLVPGMLARGSGYLLNTASAAGLLASLNSMPYGVTKNAAIALAEHLAIQYGDRGIRVSVLCPQSVQTGMTTAGPSAARVDGVLQPGEVARMVIEAMEAERFLILSHPQVQDYIQRKASSRDRWLGGMRRLRDRIYGTPDAE